MVSEDDILLVHTSNYGLHQVYQIDYLAQILEIPLLAAMGKMISAKELSEKILNPMKWAVAGTIKAAELALSCGIAVNMSGGYHHASRSKGEGFCVFSDIAIAIEKLRKMGILRPRKDKIAIIDLDAHQGNGLERIFSDDSDVRIMDMYNADIYPQDWTAKSFIDLDVPLSIGTSDPEYLSQLKLKLVEFIKSFDFHPKIAFYNAGTDIYCQDSIGGLNISKDGVFERDRFVLSFLAQQKIPCVMVLSGGYTTESYSLISRTLFHLIYNN
jgi:histone deacetylase 11